MDPLPRIPSPRGAILRELRARFTPVAVFAAAAVAAVVLWRDYQGPTSLVGEVETHHARIDAPFGGRISGLKVQLMDQVVKGQILGAIESVDARTFDASVALSRARLARWKAGASELDEAARKRTESRISALADRLDHAVVRRNNLASEEKDARPPASDAPSVASASNPEPAGSSALDASLDLESQSIDLIESQLAPSPIVAPRDGWVSSIKRHHHEAVGAGETILVISASKSDHIVAYVRQPIGVKPEVDAEVDVHSRSGRREHGRARILRVGGQLEPLSPELLPVKGASDHERGLPILVSVPAGMRLVPGEVVDLHLVE
jgi:multidrug resistance efflux pump